MRFSSGLAAIFALHGAAFAETAAPGVVERYKQLLDAIGGARKEKKRKPEQQ